MSEPAQVPAINIDLVHDLNNNNNVNISPLPPIEEEPVTPTDLKKTGEIRVPEMPEEVTPAHASGMRAIKSEEALFKSPLSTSSTPGTSGTTSPTRGLSSSTSSIPRKTRKRTNSLPDGRLSPSSTKPVPAIKTVAFKGIKEESDGTSSPKRSPRLSPTINRRKGFMHWAVEEITGSQMDGKQNQLSKTRDDVYNFIRVPWQLEKACTFGFFACMDAFLFYFSFFPIRILLALFLFLKKIVQPSKLTVTTKSITFADRIQAGCVLFDLLFYHNRTELTPGHIYDLLRFVIGCFSCWILSFIDASILYHFIKGQAVIKLYVIFNAIEIFDKLCCAFGQDVFDSLFLIVRPEKDSHKTRLRPITHFVVSLVYTAIHSVLIYVRVITMNVAVNSYNNALLTLLVSNNFIEVKASVFKNYKEENLFQVTCSDVLERFQLLAYLFIVIFHNMHDLEWNISMSVFLMNVWVVGIVLGSEFVVDWIKHCFILKFNNMSADIYAKFSMILRSDVLDARNEGFLDPSSNVARRIGFIPLPLACLVLRVCFHIFPLSGWLGVVLLVVFCLVIAALKVLIRILLLGSCLTKFEKLKAESKKLSQISTPYVKV